MHCIIVIVAVIWPLAAREAMRQPVRDAGILRGVSDEIIIIDEPEAAVLSPIGPLESRRKVNSSRSVCPVPNTSASFLTLS